MPTPESPAAKSEEFARHVIAEVDTYGDPRIYQLAEDFLRSCAALRDADLAASEAHTAIWNVEEHARVYEREPRRIPLLHGEKDSASAAIWKIHTAIRRVTGFPLGWGDR